MGRQSPARAAALVCACLLLAAPSLAEKLALHAPGGMQHGSKAAGSNRRLLQIFG